MGNLRTCLNFKHEKKCDGLIHMGEWKNVGY